MPDATIHNQVHGATSVEAQQQEASVLAFFVPPATSGSSFSFSISAAGGITFGTITTDDSNLTVSGTTVTVQSGFTGKSTVTIPLNGAIASSATFTVTRISGSDQTGSQTSLDVDTFGWFKVRTLGTGASFNALSYTITGLPSNQDVQLFLSTPLFLIPSVTGTDYSFTIGNTASVANVGPSVESGSGLTQSNNTVTATSDLTPGMRSLVTVTYTESGIQKTTQFAIQRLSAAGTGTASNIQVGNLGNILVPSLPAGVHVRGNNVSYQTTMAGRYHISYLGVGDVTFSAVTMIADESTFTVNLDNPTSITITTENISDQIASILFNLHTNLGIIDPQIANNPDTDFRHNWKRTS